MSKTIRFDAKSDSGQETNNPADSTDNRHQSSKDARTKRLNKGKPVPEQSKKFLRGNFDHQRIWPCPNEQKNKKGHKI